MSRFFELMSEAIHIRDSIVATVRGNGIKTFWYRNDVNFGDLITPCLLSHYGFTPVFDQPMRAQIFATGSLLEILPDEYAGIILGTGFIQETSRRDFLHARILAVRGKLTRERLGLGCEKVALGDPGLLASALMPEREKKRFMVGIVPHYIDKNNVAVKRLADLHRKDLSVINVQQQPMQVFREIDRCRCVISSSLHGLIVADSLGIPNAWLVASGLKGGRFKYDDYYSALDVPAGEPVTLSGSETIEQLTVLATDKPAERITQIKNSLHYLWSSLKKYL